MSLLNKILYTHAFNLQYKINYFVLYKVISNLYYIEIILFLGNSIKE